MEALSEEEQTSGRREEGRDRRKRRGEKGNRDQKRPEK